MQHLEVSGAVGHIYIYIYVIRQLKFKAPDHLHVRHYKGGRSSVIRTGRLYPRRNPWYSFSEAESPLRGGRNHGKNPQ